MGVLDAPNTRNDRGIMGACDAPMLSLCPIMGGVRGHQTSPMAPMLFFDNLVKKNLPVAGVLRKNIWFSLPVPKLKFDPSR